MFMEKVLWEWGPPLLGLFLLIFIPCGAAYAWHARKRHPLFLPRLGAIAAAIFVLNLPAVLFCLGIFQPKCLDLLPFACGDGSIADGLAYIFGGYGTSLIGLAAYYIYAVLYKRRPKTARVFGVALSAAALLGIIAFMIAHGRRQGGFMLYWFTIFQMGFWIMLLADAVACRLGRRRQIPDQKT
jgi:hypothetical protein